MKKIKDVLKYSVESKKTIYLAGGCFWGVEGYFKELEGVLETQAGYANGTAKNPTYEEVCREFTGHAETVKISYNQFQISLEELILHFFRIIDPFTLNRQGNDIGKQYRTGIYYEEEEDYSRIEKVISFLQNKFIQENEKKERFRKIQVEVKKLQNYYPAEEYHQDYLEKNPLGYCHINLNIAKEPLLEWKAYQKESNQNLKDRIGEVSFAVTKEGATERPFSSKYDNFFEQGIYVDIVSGEPLFISTDKFDAGCGWPSFSKPITQKAVVYREDQSHGMERIEVKSNAGDSHLGHVFSDGPKEIGGRRYCINGASLRFIPLREMEREGYGEYIPLLG